MVFLRSKKGAMIGEVIIDFWSYVLFVLVLVVFAVLYRYSATSHEEALIGKVSQSYGNYLAQVYLMIPVSAGDLDISMAELIAIYEYNQSLYTSESHHRMRDNVANSNSYLRGRDNVLSESLFELTGEYIIQNFNSNKCYVFIIKADNFEYVQVGNACFEYEIYANNVLRKIKDIETYVDDEAFKTYVAPVDAREKPIEIYSIYDLGSFGFPLNRFGYYDGMM